MFELFFVAASAGLLGLQVYRYIRYGRAMYSLRETGALDGYWRRTPGAQSIRPYSQTFPQQGLDHLDAYLDQLLASNAPTASLGIFHPVTHSGFGLTRREGEVFFVFFLSPDSKGHTDAIAGFFADRGIEAAADEVAIRGFFATASRMQYYPAPQEPYAFARLCRTALIELCGIEEGDGLTFLLDSPDIAR